MRDAWTAGRTAPDARLLALPRDAANLPGLPDEFRRALDGGLAELGLDPDLDVDAGARPVIDTHVRLLLAWNAAINLTGITDPAAVATRHVVDSLSALPLLRGIARPGEPLRIADLGSGGGFPGLPLAAAFPSTRVALVESVGKKAEFLRAVVAATGLGDRVSVRAGRAEELAAAVVGRRAPAWDVVLARAVADLAELVELALPLLVLGGRLVAWKRGDLGAELEAGRRAAKALGGSAPVTHPLPPIRGLEGHVLVVVRKAGPTPPGHPRDPARRRSRPW